VTYSRTTATTAPDRPTTLPRRGRSTALPPFCLPTWPLLASLVGELPPVRRGRRCPPLHAVPRPQEVRRHFVPFTLPARTRTTFRCVAGEPTLSASSRLYLRRSPHPVLCAASAAGTEAAKRYRQGQRHQRGRQLLRQRLRLVTRATVVNNANAPSPHYPPAVSCSLRTSLVMPTLITKSSTEHATASGKGVATRPQRCAPVVPPRHCTCCCKFVPCPLPRAAHGTC